MVNRTKKEVETILVLKTSDQRERRRAYPLSLKPDPDDQLCAIFVTQTAGLIEEFVED